MGVKKTKSQRVLSKKSKQMIPMYKSRSKTNITDASPKILKVALWDIHAKSITTINLNENISSIVNLVIKKLNVKVEKNNITSGQI